MDNALRSEQGPVLVTGGAGFIGSALVRRLVADGLSVVNVDKLTYAGNLDSLGDVVRSPNYNFFHADITDAATLASIFRGCSPQLVFHLAAESHVDRSIDAPHEFVQTNVVGTVQLLEAARRHFTSLDESGRRRFRFIHVSTDEVFGSLGGTGCFDVSTPYAPRSPYAASKAASDHFARAWMSTYDLPVIVTNCSNNYGPFQFPEKLIPLMILAGLRRDRMPLYGDGSNVRDWIFVDDHVSGLIAAAERGAPGETYLFGGDEEHTNLEVVRLVCELLDELAPDGKPHEQLIHFVADRPGHDHRYAIDSRSARDSLQWRPTIGFRDGLQATLAWYMEHREWVERVQSGAYHGERLGLSS